MLEYKKVLLKKVDSLNNVADSLLKSVTLQGKGLAMEVIVEFFSVTRSVKINKKTSSTTSTNGTRCFNRGFYENVL